MARWFTNGTKMPDGTLISFGANTIEEVNECLGKGWKEITPEDVESFIDDKAPMTEPKEIEGITKSKRGRPKKEKDDA